MIPESKKRIIKHQYTIVELLVVLVIAGLLTGMTISGIKGALARQGATNAVRTLAAKISLAQSFAVSKNRYVALIIPDHVDINTDLKSSQPPNEDGYEVEATSDGTSIWNGEYLSCFRKNRMCYVTKNASSGDYEFDRWVDGYEWQALPVKTVAFITTESTIDSSSPAQVTKVPDPTDPSAVADDTSTALIFKPSGALVSASSIVIRIFRAAYDPDKSTDHFIWQGEENKNKGWKIFINGFTGRSRFGLGGEKLSE